MAHRKQPRARGRKRTAAPARIATARIDVIGARGDGVALIDGEKVFVPLSAPGDEARIACCGERGEIEALLTKSPHRAAPPCVYYGQCGGCALQHVTAEFYREWKRKLAVDALARESFDGAIVAPLVLCAPASRRRATFAVRRTAGGLVFGFNARASAQIVNIETCLVLAPELGALVPALCALAEAAPSRWRVFDMAVTLCDNGADVSFSGGDAADDLNGAEMMALSHASRRADVIRITAEGSPVASFETPIVRFGGVPVAVPPGGFLQASAEGEAALTEFVLKNAGGAKRIADLFSGCGTFSLPLAKNAAIDAFDSDAASIAALDAAARGAGLRRPLKAERRNLFDRPLMPAELNNYDAIVFDPPRAGAKAQAEQLAQSTVPVIVGVSCNPASFARDAAILREGGYSLSQVVPVDQFVYSPHVELAGVFVRS
ncbi:MAG: hypothetical protein R3C58_07250 [Parvularculaceae bacterium]